jgi:phosphoribosylformylglycinamidine synthase
MCFADVNLGAKIDFSEACSKKRFDKILFSENGIVIQAKSDTEVESKLNQIMFLSIK